MPTSHETKPINCWHCGVINNGSMNTTSAGQPDDGDLSLCVKCGAPGYFADQVTVTRAPTLQEWVALTTDLEMLRQMGLLAIFRKEYA